MTEHKQAVHDERYAVLMQMLEDRRRDIHDRLRSLRETLPAQVAEVKDAEEQSVHSFAQDVELALMEMKSETLGQIDEAIRRLEAGTYGTCAQCGREIAEARLKALPFASLCRDCQEIEEEARASERSQETRALSRFATTLGSVKAEGEL
ncbi:MAG TPA: TraR/DksA family transcriptional regulator [Vicinamibacteria bacterium]|nr:TraR/DksA family transcriptional regulator [Vicinamibacteria bacterium]